MNASMTSTDVRKALGLTRAQFEWVVKTRPELAPAKVGPIRVWSAADLARVRASLAARPVLKTRPVSSKR